MGEYAASLVDGQEVKIGTCENMYYLRPDHRHLVRWLRGNVDPNSSRDILGIRFRFPWPDEDTTARPGHDDAEHNYDRRLGVRLEGWTASEAEHYSIQFQRTNDAGTLLASLPCPYGKEPPPVKIGRNGWSGGDLMICQQAYRDQGDGLRLVTIASCPACGARYQLTKDEAERVAVAIRAEADRTTYDPRANDGQGAHVPCYGASHVAFLHAVADRMLAGYDERRCARVRPWEVWEGDLIPPAEVTA